MLVDTMQHVNVHPIETLNTDLTFNLHEPSPNHYPDHISQTSAGSPVSQTTATKSSIEQLSQTNLPTTSTRELTPPSSVSSSRDGIDQPPRTHNSEDTIMNGYTTSQGSPSKRGSQNPTEGHMTGKKRTASGDIKHSEVALEDAFVQDDNKGHSRNVSTASSSSIAELSSQLRTRLTYAMVKVQNGWQDRSLDEVESLANQSPRSVIGFSTNGDGRNVWSPRTMIASKLNRAGSDSSSGSDTVIRHQTERLTEQLVFNRHVPKLAPPPSRKSLAPPANIVAAPRRKRLSIGQIHSNGISKINTAVRPTVSQRTPSQNAAMEADAVETLLFMASPNNSGHHPSNHSPITSSGPHYSSQTSPLRSQFNARYSPISPKRVAFSPDTAATDVRPHQRSSSMVDQLINDLDDDGNEVLDEAVGLIDRQQVARLST